ncbi:ion channel [Microbulbifer hydrolyticus]|uniref:Membrane protein n=1 Tax=Microbulbifer hydrolyticus TaxID=48074 RepID=A0A6P1TAC1_9GAMM|nr:ion channel [Microbulbifer hydrolyticus]MBB5212048.1 putative membrane protein [Microbulbifer hydrolyticus]QHQ39728.1 two pore domain potassium channel family protein [Microbulbifer hydrolyticus]
MLLAFVINSLLVALAVVIHHEALNFLFFLGRRLSVRRNVSVLIGVFGALVAHVVEIWMFALGYMYMYHSPHFGTLEGNFTGSLLDSAYFSFTTYTSLGLGDIEPFGALRFTVGLEALTGLVLITWTASFLFLKMQRFWKLGPDQ